MNTMRLDNNGVTLTEVLVASAVGLVVAGGIFSFVTLSGRLTDETKVQQQMEIQTSTIHDMFARTIRGASVLMVESDTKAPTANVATTGIKAIGTTGDTTIYRIANSKYFIRSKAGVAETLATDLDTTKTSNFLIYKDGNVADMRIAFLSRGNEGLYQRKMDTVQVRCRNYMPPQLVASPFMDPLNNFSNNQISNPNITAALGGILSTAPDNNTGGVATVSPPPVENPTPPPPPPPWWKRKSY